MNKKDRYLLIKKLNIYPKGVKKIYPTRQPGVQMKLSPALAAEWADLIFEGQRDLGRGHVKNLSARMAAGQWFDNGEPIAFDWYGRIINGQHRIYAVIDSGVTVDVTVIYGMDPIAYLHMDEITSVRKPEHYLKGWRSIKKAITAYRWMQDFQEYDHRAKKEGGDFRGFVSIGRRSGTKWDANRESVLSWVWRHQDAIEHVTTTVGHKDAKPIMPPQGLVGGFYLWIYLDSPRLADEFFGRLIDGVGLTRTSSVYALRKRLLELKTEAMKKMGTSVPYYEYSALLINAWNAFLESQPLQKVTFNAHKDAWPVRTGRKTQRKKRGSRVQAVAV
jgi:hypothetical protein